MAIQNLPSINDTESGDQIPIYSTTVGNDARISLAQLTAKILAGSTATVHTLVSSDLPDDGVTNAKMADMPPKTYKGRTSAGAGNPEDVPVATVRVDLGEKVALLTDGATVAVDASLANNFRLTLAGNRTLANPGNLIDGQVINLRITQDSTGTRTLAYGTKYKFPGGTPPVLSTLANARDFMSCQYDATDDTLYCVLNKAFA